MSDSPRPHFRTAWLFAGLCLLAGMLPARAGMLYQLIDTSGQPGAPVELQGVLFNDTGDTLNAPVADSLEATWIDAHGRETPVTFTLRTSPDAAALPVNTFTRMAWTGRLPKDAQGLMTLHLQAAPEVLLAMQANNSAEAGATVAARDTGRVTTTGQLASAPVANSAGPDTTANATPATQAPVSAFDTFRNGLSPYEPIYFVVGGKGGATGRFQLSLKYRLFSPRDAAQPGFMDHWYLGYTQTSLWDLHSPSIPFIDTTYNPSLFWMRESLWQSDNQRLALGLNAGLQHRSNGKDGDDSRSLNELYLQPELRLRTHLGSTVTLQPRFKYAVWTDRAMRYPETLGYVDWKLRWAQDNGLSLSALYRQGASGRGATQVEAAWPLKRTFLDMNGYLYLQYFQGYGETLLDYNRKSGPQFRLGIALVP